MALPVPASVCGRFGVVLLLSNLLATGALPTASASAAVLGGVDMRPRSGNDQTLFFGSIPDAHCPKGTLDSYFEIFGSDIGMEAPGGSGDMGFLGQGTVEGRGMQSFNGASIANLKTTNAGAFSRSGAYRIRFGCIDGRGRPTDSYERVLDYAAGVPGVFTLRPGPASPPAPPARPAPPSAAKPATAALPSPRATAGPGSSSSPPGVALVRPVGPLSPKTEASPGAPHARNLWGWAVPIVLGLVGFSVLVVGLLRRRSGAGA